MLQAGCAPRYTRAPSLRRQLQMMAHSSRTEADPRREFGAGDGSKKGEDAPFRASDHAEHPDPPGLRRTTARLLDNAAACGRDRLREVPGPAPPRLPEGRVGGAALRSGPRPRRPVLP